MIAAARLQTRRFIEPVAKTQAMLAPTKGWVERETLAVAEPGTSPLLQNWFPDIDGVSARKGYVPLAIAMGGPVESLMPYTVSGANSRMFAGANGNIWRVDNAAGGAPTVAVAGGFASNRWQSVQFATAGGRFLQILNGFDWPRQFDGASWSLISVTGSGGFSASALFSAFSHQSRRFYLQRDTTDVWYSGIDAASGALTLFPLGPFLQRGGSIVAGGTWSRDSAGTGLQDAAVFVTSEGEVLIYRGTNVATDWSLESRFFVGRPLGLRCLFRLGGDLAILTEDGVISLSKARNLDLTAIQQAAMTAAIRLSFSRAVATDSASFGWEVIAFPRGNKVIVNIPSQSTVSTRQFVMNSLSGAWCEFIGMNALCWAEQGGRLFFGAPEGAVHQAERGSIDGARVIVCLGYTYFDSFDNPAAIKTPTTVLTSFTGGTFAPLFVDTAFDFRLDALFPGYRADTGSRWGSSRWGSARWFSRLSTATSSASLVWNVGNWNEREWGGGASLTALRSSVAGRGRAMSVGFRLDVEDGEQGRDTSFKIARFDLTYRDGEAT